MYKIILKTKSNVKLNKQNEIMNIQNENSYDERMRQMYQSMSKSLPLSSS